MDYIKKKTFTVDRSYIAYGYYFDSYETMDGDRADSEHTLTELYVGHVNIKFINLVVQAAMDDYPDNYSLDSFKQSMFPSAVAAFNMEFDLMQFNPMEVPPINLENYCDEVGEVTKDRREHSYEMTRYYLKDGVHYIDITKDLGYLVLVDVPTFFVFYGKINADTRCVLGYVDETDTTAKLKTCDDVMASGQVEHLLGVEDNQSIDEIFTDGTTVDVSLQENIESLEQLEIYYTLKDINLDDNIDDDDEEMGIKF